MTLPSMMARLAVCASILIGASPAFAQYTRLQVLLPGESPAPGTITGKTGVPTSQTVGIAFSVTVRACDASWNTVTSITNSVLLDATDDSASLPGAFALSSGVASVSVTMNADGSFTVSADDQSDGTIPLATSAPVTVYALAGFQFNGLLKHYDAGVPMTITLKAVDPAGDVVTGFTGQVRLRELTSFGEGRIEPSIITLANGVWTGGVTNYRADETSINHGNVNIKAELVADASLTGLSDPFVVHPGPFRRVQIVVPGQLPLPGSISGLTGSPASQGAGQTFAVEVFATDDYWNPLPSGDTVRITSSDPGANTPLTGSLSNGYRAFSVSLATVGSQTLSVNDITNSSITGMTSAGIPVTASSADHFVIDPFPVPVTAGSSVAVTIRATDVGGNTIPDFAGNAILFANTGPGSISPEAIQFVDGEWSGDMVFRGAGGAVSFTCSDFASPPHMGTSPSFEVLPGPLHGLQVLVEGQTPQGGTVTGFTGAPADQFAGAPFDVRVRAVDAFWNRVPGVSDRVGLTSSDPFAGMPDEITLVNGESLLSVTLYKAGFQSITATDLDDGGIEPHTSSDVEVLPGAYSRIVLIAPGEQIAPGSAEGRSGAATDQSINFAFTMSVYATDSWFNPLGGTNDVIRLTSTDPMAQLPADTPMTDGLAELNVRLSTGGFQQLTASNVTQPSMPVSTTQVRAISSGFHLEADVTPTAVQAGEAFTLTVRVTNDAGSVIQEINSSVTVTVQNASTQEAGRGTLLNTEFQLLQGQRAIQETYTFAEPIVLVVTDDAGNSPAVTDVITVSPGPPHHVALVSDPPWVGGNKHALVQAHVLDAWENGVPNEPVEFELLVGAGTLTPIDLSSDAGGIARADFLSPRTPEIARIRASSEGLSAEVDLETALVNPNQGGGYVTNYPNPFHPDEAPTTIAYKLDADARVRLRIYSMSGAEVLDQVMAMGDTGGRAGLNEIQWNGRNGSGEPVASGGYVLVAEADRNGETIHVMRRRIAVVR